MSSLLDQILANLGNFGKDTTQHIVNTGNNLGGAVAAIGQQQNSDALRKKTSANIKSINDQIAKNPKLLNDPNFVKQVNRTLGGNQRDLGVNSSTLMRNNITTVDPTKAAGDASQTALDILSLGTGSLFRAPVQQAITTVAKDGLGAAARQYGAKLAGSAAENGLYGGAYGAAGTASDNPNATLADYAKNTALGAVTGAGLGIALPVGGLVAKQGIKAGMRAVDDATVKAAGRTTDKIASTLGEKRSFTQSSFDSDLQKLASQDDLKGAQKYLNQMKKGKDIGTVSTTTNANGYVEPVTKEGLQKYIAYKTAYDHTGQTTTNDFGGSNFTTNRYSEVPVNHIDENTLRTGLSAYKAQKEGGYIGSGGAQKFLDEQQAGRTFTAPDGLQKFEKTDREARLTSTGSTSGKLGDILDHPTLYENYPQLRDTDVSIKIDKTRTTAPTGTIQATQDGAKITVFAKNHSEAKKTLLHEIQHNIQHAEGQHAGTTPREAGSLENYKNTYSEAEARAVAERRNLTDEERYTKPTGQTLYRGGKEFASSLSTHKHIAEDFAKHRGGSVKEHTLSPNAKVVNYDDVPGVKYKDFNDYTMGKYVIPTGKSTLDFMENELEADYAKASKWAKENGYDAIKFPTEGEVRVISDKALAKPTSTFTSSLDVPKEKLIHGEGAKATKTLYHTTNSENVDSITKNGYQINAKEGVGHKLIDGVFFAHTKDGVKANAFEGSVAKTTLEANLSKDAKIKRYDSESQFIQDLAADSRYIKAGVENRAERAKIANQIMREKGYDAIEKPYGGGYETIVLNPKVIEHGAPTHTAMSLEVPKKNLPTADATKPETKLSRFANKTVQESDKVSTPLKKLVKEEGVSYETTTDKARLESADAELKGKTNEEVYTHALQKLENKKFDTKGQDSVTALSAARKLDAAGDESSKYMATEIYGQLSERLSAAGQEVQAAAMMAARSPEGIKFSAIRDLKKAGIELTPQISNQLDTLTKAIEKEKAGSDARKLAIGKLSKYVGNKIPGGKLSNLVGVWKAMMLSGTKTTEGNILSNTSFAIQKAFSDPITVLSDKGLSLFTGKRTATLTQRGKVSGTLEGFKKGGTTLKTGIDLRSAPDKYDQHADINFKNPIIQKTLGKAQHVFNWMSAQDQPFYYSQLKNSMYDLAKADGLNKGLKGQELLDHMNKTVANPPESLMESAVYDANRSVLSYDTVASKFVSGGKKIIDKMPISEGEKQIAHAVVDVVAPFIRVPTAFLSRSIDYTPLGIGKTVMTQVLRHKFDQRALSKALGEGITGTGIIALGAVLTQSGQLSGDYPSSAKEQAEWKAEKKTPNSVKLGGTWISLNYLGPIGMLFGAGKKFDESVKGGDNGFQAIGQAAAGFGQTLLNQSFLQGLSGFIDAAKDPARYWQNYANSQAGSIVPAIVNDASNLSDNFQRQANNSIDAIKARIPGLRQTLDPKQDVYGNKLTQNPWDAAFNALRPSDDQTDNNPVIGEVNRLRNVDTADTDLQVTPTPVDKTLKINGQTHALTDKQRYDLQQQVGQLTQKKWGELIKTPEYKSLSDQDKATALTNSRKDATANAKDLFALSNGWQIKNDTASTMKDITSYAKTSSGTGSGSSSFTLSPNLDSTSKSVLSKYANVSADDRTKTFYSQPDAEYQYDLAKYKNDVANKSLSTAQTISKKSDLAREAVGSTFSKDIRDLYSLSKSQLYGYVSTDPNGNSIAQQVIAYGDALQSAGVADNKFRSKSGAVTLNDGSSSGSSGKTKTASFKAASTSATLSAYKAAKGAKLKRSSTSLGAKKARGLLAYKKPAKAKQFKA